MESTALHSQKGQKNNWMQDHNSTCTVGAPLFKQLLQVVAAKSVFMLRAETNKNFVE